MTETSGDPFNSASGRERPERLPAPTGMLPPEIAAAMPKLWIGYLLAAATFIGETIAVSRNPELLKSTGFIVPPLEIFLPAFVARAYWFVCIYRYHKILAAVPGYTHPISAAKAVGFHFIPIFNFFWIFSWPSAIADFVNARLRVLVMRGWVVGVGILAATLCQAFLDAGFGVALLFLAIGYVAGFLKRALAVPSPEATPQP